MSAPLWRRSIRLRLTLWYSALVLVLLALLIGAMLLGQQLFSRDYFENRLNAAAREATAALVLEDGEPAFAQDLSADDVHVTVLDESGELLLGERSFSVKPKQDRMRTKNRIRGGIWYLMDFPVTLGGRSFWIRCYMSSASASRTVRTLMTGLIVAVPVLLLLTLAGGNLIAKRALKPLIDMTATAESISGSSDLDRRIQLDSPTSEVGRLASAFNSMFERLERSMEREKRFISDASHELRTPISVISAQSEFALSPGASAEEKDAALAVIRERSKRAGLMLSQMLLLSRMDTRRLPLHRERLDLSAMTEGISEELRDEASERGIELLCRAEPGVQMDGDELLLTRVLTNLIQNAIQHGGSGGHILVTLERLGERARLCVRDDGPGIPEADQSRVWERFYQVNKGGENSGSGLGLPIVRWIVEAHGGQIRLESQLGAGSAFLAELPLAPEPSAEPPH